MEGWRRTAREPQVVDALLAAVCLLVTLGTVVATDTAYPPDLTAPGVLLILGQTVPVAWRRSHPVLAWLVAGICTASYGISDFPDPVLDVGPLLIVYTVAAQTKRRTASVLGILTAAAMVVGLVSSGDADAKDISFNFLVYSLAWILGEHQRSRRAYTDQLEERAAALERERAEEARRAVLEERARIARELHDVVAHHVSMMVVQAEGGASVVRTSPEKAERAFDAIGATGRAAMREMRRVLGVLREDEDRADRLAPQPGLGAVDDLIARVRETGLEVELQRNGSPRRLPPGLDLSAYRIVQEALTNTVRHADAQHAWVSVRYLPESVEVEVADDGRGLVDGGGNGAGTGHGLVGMRERVALFGGVLRTGPREEGGFAVVARLPTGGS